jgi:hypothetical protein
LLLLVNVRGERGVWDVDWVDAKLKTSRPRGDLGLFPGFCTFRTGFPNPELEEGNVVANPGNILNPPAILLLLMLFPAL